MKRYLIALLVVAIGVSFWVIPHLGIVPRVGGDYASAERTLLDAGFSARPAPVAGRLPEVYDRALVVSQDPGAGSIRSVGTVVTIRLRPPSTTVNVPDVIGIRVDHAQAAIDQAGLSWQDLGSGLGSDVVASTIPSVGTVVPFGSRVLYAVRSKL